MQSKYLPLVAANPGLLPLAMRRGADDPPIGYDEPRGCLGFIGDVAIVTLQAIGFLIIGAIVCFLSILACAVVVGLLGAIFGGGA